MPVLLGAGGVIEGWRGVVAALAILGAAGDASSALARAVVARRRARWCWRRWRRWRCLYLLPVSSVVPIAVIFKMMASGVGAAIFALFLLIPLVFAALSLFGVMGRDLTDVGGAAVGADPAVGAGRDGAARDR